MFKKIAKKNCAGPPPPPELHIRIFLFFRFMYPGTWNFVFSLNPCTRVHDILFFLQIHVPGYMEFCFFFKFKLLVSTYVHIYVVVTGHEKDFIIQF